MNTTKIVKEVPKEDFQNIILNYKSKIKVSFHAFDILSLAQ